MELIYNILLMIAAGAVTLGATVLISFLVRLDGRIKNIEVAFATMKAKIEAQEQQSNAHSVFINEYIQSKIRS